MNPANHAQTIQASDKAATLDKETRHLLDTAKKKNTHVFLMAMFFYSILLVLGILGIWRQNQIANQNKSHIDCIVKLLATPLPPGKGHKVITDASATCGISFTQ